MTAPWYATREQVEDVLDITEIARSATQIDRALAAASRSVDTLCRRRGFWPVVETRTFDWPHQDSPTSWRLWLDENDLITVTEITAGGVTIPTGSLLLRPDNGPPYTMIEVDTSTSAVLQAGDTSQRAIHITGTWGDRDDTTPAGALAGSLNSTITTVNVTDAGAVGIGDLLQIGTERMVVTNRRMLHTGQAITTDALTADESDTTLSVADSSVFTEGEPLMIGAERLVIDDITGSTLVVRRGLADTVPAVHATGTAIYAPRALTVARAVGGTTAATHADGTDITRWAPPPLVNTLTIGEAVATLGQERAGYVGGRTPTIKTADQTVRVDYGADLTGLRRQVYAAHGRKNRHLAV